MGIQLLQIEIEIINYIYTAKAVENKSKNNTPTLFNLMRLGDLYLNSFLKGCVKKLNAETGSHQIDANMEEK
jgi:N-acetylglucosamine kinase-like BadF-type ATPase